MTLFRAVFNICLIALLATVLICCGSGAVRTPVQAPGVSIINGSPQSVFFWQGNNIGQPIGLMEVVEVSHEKFSLANRIRVIEPSGNFWDGQIQFPVNSSVSAGDVVLAHLFIRSIDNTFETGNAFTTVYLEDNHSYEKYILREISAGSEWQEYFLPATVTKNQALGNLSLKIGFGAGDRPQTFDIAGVELLNYGHYDESLLPLTRSTYDGRDSSAAWRSAAAKRIEQYRKSDFSIHVVDAHGNPLANTELDIKFQKHAYHFGSVTVGQFLSGTDRDSLIYRQKVLELFNQSGTENDLKWGPWIGEWGNNFNQEQTLSSLQWLRDNGLYTRGHVMVWPSKRHLPKLIQAYLPEDAPEEANPIAKQVVLDHIDDVALATTNLINEWDVVNEPYDNHYLMDAFGNEVMVDWFKRARSNLPTQDLYLNDYNILSSGGVNIAHQQHFQNTARFLLDNGAPITGLGMQSHFGESPTSIPLVYSVLDRFHTSFPGLDIRATEFDIRTTDEILQADYTRDFLTVFFSHPATVGVQLWGFWAGAHHAPEAALYGIDWREKPNARVWKNLIYKQWWNNFEGISDKEGAYTARGFYGDYNVTISLNGKTRSFDFTVAAGRANEFEFIFVE